MMELSTLFMFGGAISLVVFAGIFLYVMYSFKDWSERNGADATSRPVDTGVD
jgi:hypothetical protein